MRHNSDDMEWRKRRRQFGREKSNMGALLTSMSSCVYTLAKTCILTTISGIHKNVSLENSVICELLTGI